MFAAQRHDIILREIGLRGSVRVGDLAHRLDASELTIRRDLTKLAEAGLVERVHGGARQLRRDDTPPADTLGSPGRQRSARAMRRTSKPAVSVRLESARPQPSRPKAVIGMCLPSATYYFPAIIRGAEAAAQSLGVRLVLAISEYDSAEERRQIERLMSIGVDGLLATPASRQADDGETYRILADLPIPAVLVERTCEPSGDSIGLEHVRTDHSHGAQLAARHLVSRGHRRVGLILNGTSATTPWLIEGFQREAASLEINVETLSVPIGYDPGAVRAELSAALDRLLPDATAVMAHADQEAVMFTQLAIARGLRIPEDLSIVSYDDEVAALTDPPLTAVAPPKDDVGRAALMQCFQRIGDRSGRAIQHTTLLPQLVVRASA